MPTLTEGRLSHNTGVRSQFARSRALFGRMSWNFLDQAASSFSNFLIGILIARSLPADEVGAFAIGFTSYLWALTVVRGLSTDPLMVRYSAADTEVRRAAITNAVSASAALGLVVGLITACVAIATSGALRLELFWFALLMPGLLVQDALRFAGFSDGTPRFAFFNDSLWLLSQCVLLAVCIASVGSSPSALTGTWGIGALIAALLGCRQLGITPNLREGVTWVKTHFDLGLHNALAGALWLGSIQVGLIVLTATAGLAATGSIRVAQTIHGPLTFLTLGASTFGVHETAKLLKHKPLLAWRFAIVYSGLLFVVVLLWVIVSSNLPNSIGTAIVKDNWTAAKALVLSAGLYYLGSAFGAGPLLLLRALERSRLVLKVQIFLIPCFLGLQFVGARTGGARGFLNATALAMAIQSITFIWLTRKAICERNLAPTDADISEIEVATDRELIAT